MYRKVVSHNLFGLGSRLYCGKGGMHCIAERIDATTPGPYHLQGWHCYIIVEQETCFIVHVIR